MGRQSFCMQTTCKHPALSPAGRLYCTIHPLKEPTARQEKCLPAAYKLLLDYTYKGSTTNPSPAQASHTPNLHFSMHSLQNVWPQPSASGSRTTGVLRSGSMLMAVLLLLEAAPPVDGLPSRLLPTPLEVLGPCPASLPSRGSPSLPAALELGPSGIGGADGKPSSSKLPAWSVKSSKLRERMQCSGHGQGVTQTSLACLSRIGHSSNAHNAMHPPRFPSQP
jgi:hypothetical protein